MITPAATSRSDRKWIAEMEKAAQTFDWNRVHEIAGAYIQHLAAEAHPDGPEVTAVLRFLRENLRRDDLRDVADAALALDLQGDAGVRLQYGQALVDSGSPSAALMMYRSVLADGSVSDDDRAEASGGVGRCEKQLFLATTEPARRRVHLLRCVAAYEEAYREAAGRFWHGINFVAMAARAAREGAGPTTVAAAARAAADQVLRSVRHPEARDPWQKATECEVLLALERYAEAEAAAAALVDDSATTAFTLQALLRQLLEVWQLDTRTPPGQTLLPVLRSALLEKHGGGVVVAPEDVHNERVAAGPNSLEKVLGYTRFQSLAWYRKGLARCRAVARIETSVEDGVGTGFLVRGPDLHPDLSERVVVTNAHVVPEGLGPEDCVVAFHGLDADSSGRYAFRVRRLLWSQPSTDPHLDTTVLEIEGVPPDVEPIPLASKLPAVSAGGQRAYVIGHPRGLEQPQFSLQDNALLDWDDRLVHYRSPTEAGSSGSPVFNTQWSLIGVHHAGSFETSRLHGKGGTYAANEAISIEAIRAQLRRTPPIAVG